MDCPDDKTLTAFAEGRLARGEQDAFDAHSRSCGRCGARGTAALGEGTMTMTLAGNAQARPRARPDPANAFELPRGTAVGRYTVLGLVGRGGMGEVYSAYDPELDRKVALKLLLSLANDERSRPRLLREAKAIAKVSHASVIVVHDAGTYDDRVFIAMEFVDGATLKTWLETPRTRDEILPVFACAARGLAAAHAAGLVHRDFKPHNVMVARDGHARVMDFGLARELDDAGDGAIVPGATPEDLALTRTGELVGTPLYMAPEQFRAQRADARTDQFAFCVALYEALYGGAHPFGGATIDALATNVVAGVVRPPPGKHDVPTWLRRVLLRGLSVEPAARWPSMPALLEALEKDPARARRRWGAALGLGLLVVAAGVTLVHRPRRSESLCRGGPTRLAGAWEPGAGRPRRDALEAAFLRAGGPSAREIWRHVEPLLDRYATSWLGMYRDACEATQIRGEQSPETLDLRMACLDEGRTAFAALTNVLANADSVAVNKAVDAVNALPPLDRCGDVKLLRQTVAPPRDGAARARVDDLRRRLAEIKALADTGKDMQAVAEGHGIVSEARALGYRPLLAEALLTVGSMSFGADTVAEKRQESEEATWTALASGRDDIAADAASFLVTASAGHVRPIEEGQRWAHLAEAILDRMGPGQDRRRAKLLMNEGVMTLHSDPEKAIDLVRRGLEIDERLGQSEDVDIAAGLYYIFVGQQRLGRYEEALASFRRAQSIMTRVYGPDAAEPCWSNEGEILLALGRTREAVSDFERALAALPKSVPDDGFLYGYPLTGLGAAWLALGQPKRAIATLERALRVRERVPTMVIELSETRFVLARALWEARDDRARARRLAEAARDGYARTPDARSPVEIQHIDAWLAKHR